MSNSSENTVLKTLQKLENKNERDVSCRSRQEQDQQEILDLQRKVERLKQKKAVLERKLAKQTGDILDEFISHMHDATYVKKLHKAEKKEILDIANEIRYKKLQEICDAYRLVGISIESESPSKVNFRLDTFYKGQYKEAYYIEILSEEQFLKVSKHTIPHPVPLSDIEQRYLNTEIEEFFSELLKHINQYADKTTH